MRDHNLKKRMQQLSVLQVWVQQLTFMQQSVLITAVRGPDGLHKNHVSKQLLRWFRRCILYSAFESARRRRPSTLDDPAAPGGGSFTGPVTGMTLDAAVEAYLQSLDEVPHHFQLHFMHAAEIVGYKHPTPTVRTWWLALYLQLVNNMHLEPESEAAMDKRLGDDERDWRSAESVEVVT